MDSIIFNWEHFVVCNSWNISSTQMTLFFNSFSSFKACHFMNFIIFMKTQIILLHTRTKRYLKWITIWLALYLIFWFPKETTKWYSSLFWIEIYILLVTHSLIDFLFIYWKEETFLVYSPFASVIPGNRTEGTTETTVFKLIKDKQGAGIFDTN